MRAEVCGFGDVKDMSHPLRLSVDEDDRMVAKGAFDELPKRIELARRNSRDESRGTRPRGVGRMVGLGTPIAIRSASAGSVA